MKSNFISKKEVARISKVVSDKTEWKLLLFRFFNNLEMNFD